MSDQDALFNVKPREPGRIEQSAQKTIEDLRQREVLVGDGAALTVELLLGMARAVDQGLMAPKLTIATTTMARELRELVTQLTADDNPTESVPAWVSDFQKDA